MKLTIKQQRFCDEYLISGNATQAAIKAGYSPKTARNMAAENLTKPCICEYIENRLKELEAQKVADVTEVMQYLTRGLRQELEEEVVVTESIDRGISSPTIVKKKISLRDSNKCAELLAKRFGILSDNVNVSVVVPVIGGDDELEE